jgi:hypothetical protein
VAGRFIQQKNAGAPIQRARNQHALFLAA